MEQPPRPLFPEAAAYDWQPMLFPGTAVIANMGALDVCEKIGTPKRHVLWIPKQAKEGQMAKLDLEDMEVSYTVAGPNVEYDGKSIELGPSVGTSYVVVTGWVKSNPRLCWVQLVKLEVRRI